MPCCIVAAAVAAFVPVWGIVTFHRFTGCRNRIESLSAKHALSGRQGSAQGCKDGMKARKTAAFLRCMRIVAAAVAVACIALCSSSARADEGGYTITRYHVVIDAHRDNTYDVTETIAVFFPQARHCIYRDIPLRFGDNRAALTGVSTHGHQVQIEMRPDRIRLKIGDPGRTVTGEQVYAIRYTLDLGQDRSDSEDVVYLNVIGAYWDAPIEEAEFVVRLPAAPGPGQAALMRGSRGSASSAHLLWQIGDDDRTGFVEDNVLTGRITRPLNRYEGVTLRVAYPEGTFSGDSDAADPIRRAVLLLSALTVGGGLALWLLLGRDRALSPAAAPRAPDGLSPAQAGYIVDEKVDGIDLASMFVYWASHGHMDIAETGRRGFQLTKRSDLDEAHPEEERAAFDALWRLGDGGSVESGDLVSAYYVAAAAFREKTAARFQTGEQRLVDPKSQIASGVIALLGLLSFWALGFLWAWMTVGSAAGAAFIGFVLCVPYLLYAAGWHWLWRYWQRNSAAIRALSATVMLLATVLLLVMVHYLTGAILTPFERNTLAATSLAAVALRPLVRRRTPWGHAMLERALGLRRFILAADRERIASLCDENPEYFYDVLPYAMALGLTQKWARHFEGLLRRAPEWYHTAPAGAFAPGRFAASLARTAGAVQSAATSRPGDWSGGGGGSW